MSPDLRTVPVETPVSLTESLSRYFRDRAHRSQCDVGSDVLVLDRLESAQLQERFADYLLRLPDDDLRIIALSRLVPGDSDASYAPGPKVSAAIGSIGLYGTAGFGVFLESLVHAAIDDVLATDQHVGGDLMEMSNLHD